MEIPAVLFLWRHFQTRCHFRKRGSRGTNYSITALSGFPCQFTAHKHDHLIFFILHIRRPPLCDVTAYAWYERMFAGDVSHCFLKSLIWLHNGCWFWSSWNTLFQVFHCKKKWWRGLTSCQGLNSIATCEIHCLVSQNLHPEMLFAADENLRRVSWTALLRATPSCWANPQRRLRIRSLHWQGQVPSQP